MTIENGLSVEYNTNAIANGDYSPRKSKISIHDRRNYMLLRDAYYGIGGFRTGATSLSVVDGIYNDTEEGISYLVRHVREKTNKFERRTQLATYLNFLRPVLDSVISPLFAQDIERTTNDDYFQAFENDATNSDFSLTQFVHQTTTKASLYGFEIVIMDNFSNLADDKKTNIDGRRFPYLYTVDSLAILDYTLDRFGALIYLKFNESETIKKDKIDRVFARIDGIPSTWLEVRENRISPVEQVVSMPYLYRMAPSQDARKLPISSWSDVAEASAHLYNIQSLIAWQEFNNTFPILTIDSTKQENLKLDENSVLFYGRDIEGNTNAPAWISPSTDTLDQLQKDKQTLVDHIYQVSLQAVTQTGADASGESRRWADRLRQERLQYTLQKVEDFERWIANTFFAYFNKSGADEVAIKYPTNFEYLSLSEDIADAMSMLSLNLSPTNEARIRQDILAKKFVNLSDEERQKITDDETANADYSPRV